MKLLLYNKYFVILINLVNYGGDDNCDWCEISISFINCNIAFFFLNNIDYLQKKPTNKRIAAYLGRKTEKIDPNRSGSNSERGKI